MKIPETITALQTIPEDQLALLDAIIARHDEIFIIGNGGSNSIASHISQDLTKCNGKRAHAFSDPSRLTCYMNDYGVERTYEMYLKHFARSDSLVILISSSGESQNILRAAQHCVDHNINFVILTGFKEKNALRSYFGKFAQLDFWIDSFDYGVVECVHQCILHCAVRPAVSQSASTSAATRVVTVDVEAPALTVKSAQ